MLKALKLSVMAKIVFIFIPLPGSRVNNKCVTSLFYKNIITKKNKCKVKSKFIIKPNKFG